MIEKLYCSGKHLYTMNGGNEIFFLGSDEEIKSIYEKTSYNFQVINNKINEIVDAVNELKDRHEDWIEKTRNQVNCLNTKINNNLTNSKGSEQARRHLGEWWDYFIKKELKSESAIIDSAMKQTIYDQMKIPDEYLEGELPTDFFEKFKYYCALNFNPEEVKEINYIFGLEGEK